MAAVAVARCQISAIGCRPQVTLTVRLPVRQANGMGVVGGTDLEAFLALVRADGDVIDVALYSITVQNWDKTISTIPTYQLVSGSFKNWRGMSQAGGRRIKRSLNIDLNSIRFLSDEETQRFTDFELLKDYISAKETELESYNAALDNPGDTNVNLRRLTNIGTLRACIRSYRDDGLLLTLTSGSCALLESPERRWP